MHTLVVTLGTGKAGGREDLAPNSKDNNRHAELQPAGTRAVPWVVGGSPVTILTGAEKESLV